MMIRTILIVGSLLLLFLAIVVFVMMQGGVDKISFQGIELSAKDYNSIQNHPEFKDDKLISVCNMEKERCIIFRRLD